MWTEYRASQIHDGGVDTSLSPEDASTSSTGSGCLVLEANVSSAGADCPLMDASNLFHGFRHSFSKTMVCLDWLTYLVQKIVIFVGSFLRDLVYHASAEVDCERLTLRGSDVPDRCFLVV